MQTVEIFTEHLDQPAEILGYSDATANKQAHDYLAAIKDEASAAYARDPAHIDTLIFSIIDVMHTAGTDEPAHVVGVPPALS